MIRVRPLQRHLRAEGGNLTFELKLHRRVKVDETADRRLVLRKQLDETRESALSVKGPGRADALVHELNLDARVQVAQLAKPGGQQLKIEDVVAVDQRVGVEGDFCAPLGRLPDLLDIAGHLPPLEARPKNEDPRDLAERQGRRRARGADGR